MNKTPLRRLAAILATLVVLPIIVLAPAFLASLLLPQHTVVQTQPTEQAAIIDITDIDKNGTVMYTLNPPEGLRNDATAVDALNGADLIKVTVRAHGNSLSAFESGSRDDCSFTLHVRDDDPYHATTGKFAGYLKLTDGETAHLDESDFESLETCGLYSISASRTPTNP